MVKLRNLLNKVKERVEQEIAQIETQLQNDTTGFGAGPSNNPQPVPSFFSSLGSSIERNIPAVGTLSSSLERSTLSDKTPQYETVFCSTCLMIKVYGKSGQWMHLNLADVESSAEDSCHCCTLLLQGLYGLIPDIKGTKVKLNLWAKRGWLEMKVIRMGDTGEFLGSLKEWPIIEFLTTSRKSSHPLLGIRY